MKLAIFTGTYNGRYANAEESIALPIEANENIIFGKFEEGVVYEEAVSFGELEGKHSECDGDLSVKYIDTDKMNNSELLELIESLSPLNYFESFLEHNSINWWEEEVACTDKENEVEIKSKKFLDSWDSQQIYTVPDKVLDFLKEKYVIPTKTIKIKESDYELALGLLKEKGIELF